MGYYTTIIDHDIYLKNNLFKMAYERMCELNKYDELKRGGGFGQLEEQGESKWNPNKWFSWMPYNYPDVYSTMEEILQAVGFELHLNEEGDLIGMEYDNKTGNEDYFLCCLAGLVKDGSYLEFKGEGDTDYYRYSFKNGQMSLWQGTVKIDWGKIDTYELNKISHEDKMLQEWRIKWEAEKAKDVSNHVVGKGV